MKINPVSIISSTTEFFFPGYNLGAKSIHAAIVCGVLAFSSVFLAACTSLPKPTKPKPLPAPNYSYREDVQPELAKRMPWELWQPFQDLAGQPITNRQVILGDELQERGKRRSALDAYLSASSEALSPAEGEATTLRIASQYLALDQAKEALSTTGAFFKRRGAGESEVSVPFALLLAFAYGRHGDIDQSLAWFSKVSQQGRAGGPAIRVAETGLGLLLRTLPDVEFERVAVKWREEIFINEQIGRERLRRSSAAFDPDDYRSDKPFWAWFESPASTNAQRISGEPVVGLLATLSDRFAGLGRDTKQGFELAVEANNFGGQRVVVQVRDVGSEPAAASAAIRDLVTNAQVSVIAGPLLTESAVAAAQTARELAVPMLSFSKSESFQTGSGIFRLGATSSSQVEALVNSALGDYGITRFAVVYPQTPSGTELLEAFRKKLGALGLTLELELGYAASDDTSLIDVVRQLESSSAEAVFIADNLEVSERILRSFSPGLNKRIRPLGSAMWDNAQKIARSQALFERALFVTPFFAQSTRDEVRKFNESYRSKYGVNPNFLAAQGFDAATVIVNALRAGLRSSSAFESALLQSPPYRGVTGTISVGSTGELQRRFYVVEVLRDSFQEKMPPVNPTKPVAGVLSSGAVKVPSNTPLLGATEKVDSGY
ncbi:MAG: penicillin-binding protein activator [Pseudomonadota bacterium]|jgi:branched-chain amino acid transport system substrate-binding protein